MPSFPHRFGWLPDLPDSRDYTSSHLKIKPILPKTPSKLPENADLRAFCPPIFDQGALGSCTANAAAALLEYYRRKSELKTSSLSRMFIYKATRDLMQSRGDTGAFIRTTMGALALFGAPPEKYWSYRAPSLDLAPPAFCYSYAQNYQAMSYFRADPKAASESDAAISNLTSKKMIAVSKSALKSKNANVRASDSEKTLDLIRKTIASGLPFMFGFRVFESIQSAGKDGKIPFPADSERLLGGHAVLAVGYDDTMAIGACKGAFLIRNSWGEKWGEAGYGWLPYDYLRAGLAEDWWCLVKAEWVETGEFGV